MSSDSADFGELIARIAHALADRELPFMLIGGQAVLLHGEPRLTQDIDIALGTSPGRLDDALAACNAAGLSALPDDVARFVRDTFVLPSADPETGIRVDLIFSTTPYEAEAIRRAVFVAVGGRDVPFASAEDLILHKLFAGRPRDLEDAAGVVRRKVEHSTGTMSGDGPRSSALFQAGSICWSRFACWSAKPEDLCERSHRVERIRHVICRRHPHHRPHRSAWWLPKTRHS